MKKFKILLALCVIAFVFSCSDNDQDLGAPTPGDEDLELDSRQTEYNFTAAPCSEVSDLQIFIGPGCGPQ